LSECLTFLLRSNYKKSNHLRGIPVPNMYFFVTVSTKASVIVAANGEPLFARANPQAGRLAQNFVPGVLPQGSGLSSAAEAKDGENSHPTRKNARKGSFRPKKRRSRARRTCQDIPIQE